MQLQLRTRLVRDVATTWPALDFARLDRSWPAWLRVMAALIGRYHGESARQAGLYYLAARQQATGDPGTAAVATATAPAAEWLARALGYAAPGTYQRKLAAGASPEMAARHALTQTLGTASRITLDGGRATVLNAAESDKKAVGYYRVTDGDPCAFCALMASRVVLKDGRGRFYTSAANAGADKKWHNDCGCTVAVAYSRDLDLPETSVLADAIYRDGNGSLADFRKAWNEHLANKRPAA